MNQNNISASHKTSKKNSYWENLTGGNTSSYKEKVMEELIGEFAEKKMENILDIGCGTCETIFKYKDLYNAKSVTCMDYDVKVIDFLKVKYGKENANWIVKDIFTLADWQGPKFDLVLLLDVVHELYSFYGRPTMDVNTQINHAKGMAIVKDLLRNVSSVVNKNGSVVITDNIVCEENTTLQIKVKSPEAIEAVKYFFENYPTKKFAHKWTSGDVLEMNSRDFCTLLTQYNKVKTKNWDRWNVERLETHQYFTLKEYESAFNELGFTLHPVVGTPDDAKQEWNDDFHVLSGMAQLPEKRITLLAKKDL